MDSIKRQYTKHRSKSRKSSQCTREDDLNVEEFMRDDLRAINKEEDKVQRELLNIHKQNLHKHH